jgi:NADPH:quinone reductase-like Zn-dependent oxidoreductase
LLDKNWSIGGLNLGKLWGEIDRLRPVMGAVLEAWKSGAVKPVVASTFPLEEAGEAHRMLEERRNIGKTVIVC